MRASLEHLVLRARRAGQLGNLSDYSEEDIDDSSAEHCIVEVDRLLQDVTAWLEAHRPQLTDPQVMTAQRFTETVVVEVGVSAIPANC